MEADLPDEADVPPDGHADRRDDQTGSGRTARPGGTEAETRSHEECYNDLRLADATQKSVTARRIAAEEQAAADEWNEKKTESRWMWTEYERKWPPEERSASRQVQRSAGFLARGSATDSWIAPTTAELKQHVTGSPNASERRSRQRCAPSKAKIQTAT